MRWRRRRRRRKPRRRVCGRSFKVLSSARRGKRTIGPEKVTKTKTTRPPFVVGVGDSARARFLSVAKPLKENRGGFFRTGDTQKTFHRHSSPAGLASGAPPSVSMNAPALSSSLRAREEPSPRAETDANADLFTAAVDATRSLFDAVERRVRDAVEREMETRHRRGVAEGVEEPSPASVAGSDLESSWLPT